MTRINCVPVQELTTKHLVAEYRELPRVFTLARKSSLKDIPNTYRMGAGHVRFFYNKLLWLIDRYNQLIDEMIERGYNPNPSLYNSVLSSCESIPKIYLGWWTPDDSSLRINRKRIQQRTDDSENSKRNLGKGE